MKNQFIKNARGSIIAIVALAFLFVVAQSVVAASGPSGPAIGDLFLNGSGRVEQFQLSPPVENYSPSNEGKQFRVHGQSILSDTIINEDARFTGTENGDPDDPNQPPTPNGVFNVGYNSTSEVPDLAQLQVNGSIKVSDLADPSKPGLYCLCADGYGVLKRCGVYNPAIGETCEGAL